MPVLLTREEEFEAWLSGSTAEALALGREYPPEQMRIVQEGFFKEDRFDIAACLSFRLCSNASTRYKCWRARDNLTHVIVVDGRFDEVPDRIKGLGPWVGSREGQVEGLK